MNEEQIRNARFETELAHYNLLSGDATAVRKLEKTFYFQSYNQNVPAFEKHVAKALSGGNLHSSGESHFRVEAHNQQHKIQALGKDNTGTESGIRRVKGLQETAPHARGSMRNTSGFTPKELEEGRDCLRVCMKSKEQQLLTVVKGATKTRRVNAVAIDLDDEEYTDSVIDGDDSGEREVNTVQIRTLRGQAARLSVLLNGVRVQMLYDPGAARIHVDYAGPFEGKYWLVVIDAFSKWLEIKPMQVSTAAVTIKALREIFCRFGLPRVIVSDNGPQFIASEFKDFCTANNITHIRATPYHPKTNGLAERAVRTFKERFSATKMHRDDLDLTLQRFLISYRNTPHKSTGRSPAELLLGRRIRTKLNLLKPDINHYMDKALTQQKVYHDTRAKFSSFSIGDLVWVGRPEGKGYESGCIMRKTRPLSYIVNVNGIERRKHADQLRKRMAESDVEKQLIHPHTSQPVYRRKNLDPVPQPPPSVQDPSVRQQGNFQPNAIHQPQQDQLGADERSEPESVSDQTVKEPGHELPKGSYQDFEPLGVLCLVTSARSKETDPTELGTLMTKSAPGTQGKKPMGMRTW
eukprot:Em0010g557a